MIIMFAQLGKYNPKGFLKKSHSVSPALFVNKSVIKLTKEQVLTDVPGTSLKIH